MNPKIFNETDPLKEVMVWGEPGCEALLAQLLPKSKSLFFSYYEVPEARAEFNRMQSLIEQISRFPQTIQQAANEYRPLVMAAYAYDLANTFHSFYHAVNVMQTEDKKIRNSRLHLVEAAKQTIENALRLLDIQSPDVM